MLDVVKKDCPLTVADVIWLDASGLVAIDNANDFASLLIFAIAIASSLID
jgi:hypothetical protein